ncbi:kinase-like protein [Xylona heveae TC161]|uniref:Kinase-like protein n=1 Tax=Xylona heveae (strain CBS 132557 / TC161) TaxID=1328760 RepID=A0A165FFE1_XYLHT|nr:kinase-like protein [Xylona heveae TC161]KZF20913.1 kinase-like protein [Xylona heveae TC161]
MSKDNQKQEKLTAAAIEEALQGRFPSFGDVSPCYQSSEGCHHDVWFVGRNLILRGLPQPDEESEPSLEKDSAVSKLLRQHLSKPNLVPEVLGRVTIGDWICNVEVRVHGTSLEETSPTEATGDDLVTLLQDLASVPIEEARMATKCGEEREERQNLEELVPEAIEAWGELMHCKYVEDAETLVESFLRFQLSQLSTLQEEEEYRPVLLHGDISTEHVLIDEVQGTVNGIIDWSDAMTGDPCVDISGLSLTVGRVKAIHLSKKTSYSRLTIERGLLFAMCLVITDIRGTVCGDDEGPEELLKREFRRAFEGAGVDDVTFSKSFCRMHI